MDRVRFRTKPIRFVGYIETNAYNSSNSITIIRLVGQTHVSLELGYLASRAESQLNLSLVFETTSNHGNSNEDIQPHNTDGLRFEKLRGCTYFVTKTER